MTHRCEIQEERMLEPVRESGDRCLSGTGKVPGYSATVYRHQSLSILSLISCHR
jgi:hypothetical protein